MYPITGQTALVTGASTGLGAAIARELARQGVHLVLVARSRDKLEALAQELRTQFGVRASALAADLEQADAGFGTYGAFEEIAPEEEQREIALNVAAVVDLSHAFVPGMLARGAGVVLNIASTAAFQPTPYMAVYGATKAFVLSFSEALWAEYASRGVRVVALCPGALETPFIERLGNAAVRQTSVFAHTVAPEVVASRAVRALRSRSPTHVPGAWNWLMTQSVRVSPRRMVAMLGAALMRPPGRRTPAG
jgi:short-subunit dehydrogenase